MVWPRKEDYKEKTEFVKTFNMKKVDIEKSRSDIASHSSNGDFETEGNDDAVVNAVTYTPE